MLLLMKSKTTPERVEINHVNIQRIIENLIKKLPENIYCIWRNSPIPCR